MSNEYEADEYQTDEYEHQCEGCGVIMTCYIEDGHCAICAGHTDSVCDRCYRELLSPSFSCPEEQEEYMAYGPRD